MRRSLQRAAECAELHRMLGNPRRLLMLWLLEQGERSVGELAEAVGASLQSTSQHLRLLRQHGLVGSRREGQTVFYTIEGQVLPGTTLRLEQPSDDPSSAAEKRRPRPSHKEISHV